MNLTPQEVLQALVDGKKLEYRWHGDGSWTRFNPLDNGVYIDNVFKEKFIFRLAKETITIGDVSFPKPESEPLEEGIEYWVAEPSYKHYAPHSANIWANDNFDKAYFRRGLVHLSRENAIAHAKALIKLSGGNVDE